MSRRYDSRTTIFSPEGRLFQVEYAMEAISHAGSCVGINTTGGVVVAAEKKILSKLLEKVKVPEKLHQIDEHVAVAVAGLTSDANILINYVRLAAQRYRFTYGTPMPVEQLVQQLCDRCQGYTQFGGQRPFGVSFLFAGWDKSHGYQLYQSDPSGNFAGWKAAATGANKQSAEGVLRGDYKDDLSLEDGIKLAIKVLTKSMDSTALTADKLEVATISRDPATGAVTYTVQSEEALQPFCEEAVAAAKAESEAK
mmetsp:Transcript_1283/g.4753  ORF Transcript_1283/g.4753 Transcript_1283/m.4753 type:complete len:253 (+) Transcript_1283:90-848(+)